MKILALEYGHGVRTVDESVVCYPDSTLIRNNDDFYLPNFSKEIIAYCGVYVQFAKIGKCVEPRFVPRYYTEAGVGVKFLARDVMVRNKPLGTTTDIARCFDSSLAVSNERLPAATVLNPQNLLLQKNGVALNLDADFPSIDNAISVATHYFTLKIGDLFFFPCSTLPLTVSIGDVFDVEVEGRQMLTCSVR